MAQNVKKLIRPFVLKLRKKGLSYSDIQKEVSVPKSTLSTWLSKVKLTDSQVKILTERKIRAAKIGSDKKVASARKAIEETQRLSAGDIINISPREFWLMGVVLYWKSRFLNKNDEDLRKGVSFFSSDAVLIKFFLKWLNDVGRLNKSEIKFDIYIKQGPYQSNADILIIKQRTINFWSKITGFPGAHFTNVYFQNKIVKMKKALSRKDDRRKDKLDFGILKVRVAASSMLARQIFGWTKGIQKVLKLGS